jgi:transcriptional regulator GlxA family with amidase domain
MTDRALPFVPRRAPANEVHTPDPWVLRALAAMKAEPARPWTVAALAKVAGLSRAPFARRFREATGRSPVRWLAEQRLAVAEELLLETDLGLAAIAAEIGYGSEFAFSKAFKRRFGVAPGVFRRSSVTAVRAAA